MNKLTVFGKSPIYIERKARAKKALYFLITLLAISIILSCFNNFILSNLYISLPILTVVLTIMLAYIFKDKIFSKAKSSENSLLNNQEKAQVSKESSLPIPVSSTASGSSPSVPVSSTASGSSSIFTPSSLSIAPIAAISHIEDSVSVMYHEKPIGYGLRYAYVRVTSESEKSLISWINHLKKMDVENKLAIFKNSSTICYVKIKDDKDTQELRSILRLYNIEIQSPPYAQPHVDPSSDFWPLPSVSLATTFDPNLCIVTCQSIYHAECWKREVERRCERDEYGLKLLIMKIIGEKRLEDSTTFYVRKQPDQPGTLIDNLTSYHVAISDTHAYLFPQVTIKMIKEDSYQITAHSPEELSAWMEIVNIFQDLGCFSMPVRQNIREKAINSWQFQYNRTSTQKTLAEILHFIPPERISFETSSSVGPSSATYST